MFFRGVGQPPTSQKYVILVNFGEVATEYVVLR
jgi:hypothetical protein